MPIDQAKLREHALELQRLLAHYAPLEPEAAMIWRELTPLIEAVLDGSARLPLTEVPCGWHFIESKVADLDDLANAYSGFAFLAKGRDANALNKTLARLETQPEFAARMLSPRLTWRERLWSAWVRLTRPTGRR